jgi:DNA-binding protein HU-beta
MTKTELIDAMAEQSGITKKSAGDAFNALFGEMTRALGAGEAVSIIGFGVFKQSYRAAREGRNPKTGEVLKIKASKSVRFTAGKSLKEAVNAKKKG